MNKKLLAALIAMSMVSAYACDDDDNSKDSNACSTPQVQMCQGNDLMVCTGTSWIKASTCPNGCDAATQKCKADKCTGISSVCVNTTDVKICSAPGVDAVISSCPNGCDATTNSCKTAACTKNEAECTGSGMVLDSVKCECVAPVVGCQLNDAACAAQNKNFDAQKCACVDKICDLIAKNNECIASGKELDAASCSCKDKCNANEKVFECGTAGMDFDPATCSCKPKSTDPKEGDACDATNYPGVCSADKKTGFYCTTTNVLKAKVCNEGTACESNGKNGINCVDPNAESCTKETYPGGCAADGMSGSFCNNNGKVQTVTCKEGEACNNKDGYISCLSSSTGPCAPGGTAYCDKTCNADKSEGYYYSKGAVQSIKCAQKDCTINGNSVVCASEVTTCTNATFTASCAADGLSGQFCGSSGTVQTTKCEEPAKPCTNDAGYIACGMTDCTADSKEHCIRTCTADKSTGYYWSANGVQTVTCAKNDCEVSANSGKVVCASDVQNCGDDYVGSCSDDGKTGYFCSNKEVKTAICPDANCRVNGTFIGCECGAASTKSCASACSADKKSGYYWDSTSKAVKTLACPNADCTLTGNKVTCGAPTECKFEEYKANCVSDALGKRCDQKSGIVVDWTCKTGTKCDVDMSKPEYPNGYLQCK